MTREQLRDTMKVSGELERYNKTPNWDLAFDLYKQSTGDKEVSIKCSSCFGKVKKWLTK